MIDDESLWELWRNENDIISAAAEAQDWEAREAAIARSKALFAID